VRGVLGESVVEDEGLGDCTTKKRQVGKCELRSMELMKSWCLLRIEMFHSEGAKASHYRIETSWI